jgi:hypothetical protein
VLGVLERAVVTSIRLLVQAVVATGPLFGHGLRGGICSCSSAEKEQQSHHNCAPHWNVSYVRLPRLSRSSSKKSPRFCGV